jgi:hypothetical protein
MDAEVVVPLHIVREPGYLYYLRRSEVWRVPRPGPDGDKGPPSLVAAATIADDGPGWVYFLDAKGNIARAQYKDAPSSP